MTRSLFISTDLVRKAENSFSLSFFASLFENFRFREEWREKEWEGESGVCACVCVHAYACVRESNTESAGGWEQLCVAGSFS